MARLARGDLLWRTGRHEPAAPFAGVGTKISDPVSTLDDVQIVLDDQHRMTGVHEPLEDLEQHAHIVEVQASRRLVEEEEDAKGVRE